MIFNGVPLMKYLGLQASTIVRSKNSDQLSENTLCKGWPLVTAGWSLLTPEQVVHDVSGVAPVAVGQQEGSPPRPLDPAQQRPQPLRGPPDRYIYISTLIYQMDIYLSVYIYLILYT